MGQFGSFVDGTAAAAGRGSGEHVECDEAW